MDFPTLLKNFTTAVEQADYDTFGQLFTEDATYHDGFYGPFQGRDAITGMLRHHFHGGGQSYKWLMEDPVYQEPMGYARYIFSYDSKIKDHEGQHVIFEGMSQFTIQDGQIKCYREIFDRGVPLTQLDFPAERIKKSLQRWTTQLLDSDRTKKM